MPRLKDQQDFSTDVFVKETSLATTTTMSQYECTSIAEFLRTEAFQRKLYLLSNVFKTED